MTSSQFLGSGSGLVTLAIPPPNFSILKVNLSLSHLLLHSLILSLSLCIVVVPATASEREEMKCFHFTNGEKREDDDGIVSKAFKVSWAHSFSIASSTAGTRRSEFDSDSRDFGDFVAFFELLT